VTDVGLKPTHTRSNPQLLLLSPRCGSNNEPVIGTAYGDDDFPHSVV
jgi:hypothetical protein